uniref:Sema domain-containing protein n=1 Tax=Pygocentrus nattereri TaxID=42514 RepID=A0A3B4EFG3_PYGNA
QTLTWMSTDVEKCTMRGKNTDECYNYIKVLVLRNDETLFACGTNAFNPTCRNYRLSSLEQVGVELVGQARCPFESHQANVGIFAGGQFYSATMSDFQASDAVIYRSLGGEGSPVLRSIKYDSKWLREPQFVHAIEYGSYVYIFFSEIAVESMALGKVMYSRVARVCKNDSGGSARVLERYWTSFLKARLNCSVPGESIFYFDVLQSISNVIQINQRPAVVGVFTTQKNSIPGSAVCGFYMDEIERVFRGRFKEQKGTDSAWSAVPEEQVPKPRPGSCAGDGSASAFSSSVLFPDSMLSFIKAHPLMDECVSSINNQPFLTHTISGCRLTQIVVDTVAGPYKNCTVIFLGSEDGHVLKVLMNSDLNSSQTTTLLEDIHVYNPSKHLGLDRKVLGLEMDKEHHALFVAFSSCIIRVPLSRCTQLGLLGPHPGARPGGGAPQRMPGGRVFTHGSWPGLARKSYMEPLSHGPTTHGRGAYGGLVHCGSGGS